ncbi:sodium channel protein Nach-like [Pararge aegeria]|uniref:sodium channel protein Nach-like n=1 Tax=Pararge aegeria TaxID=116150 RepID=UPI0019D10913|nr:sodium channel protein Nach-like [Pararge aegeria]
MKGDFKTLLRNFCLDSSVLGLKYFYIYPDPVSRCYWAVSIVLAFFMSCALSILLYNRFAEMPTRIAVENQYASIHDVPYPAITICSPNQITISSLEHFEKTLAPEIMGMVPQRCDDFLKLCYLKRKRYPNCKGLFEPILTKHGMCCIFNSIYRYNDKIRNEKVPDFVPHTTFRGGLAEALTVVADYNPENALSGTLLLAGAVRIMFTMPDEFPADDESNLVRAYTESFHSIHATYTYCSEEVTTLPYWRSAAGVLESSLRYRFSDNYFPISVRMDRRNYSRRRQCYFEDEYFLPFFHHFHNSDCDLLCYVHSIEDICHCTMMYMPNVWPGRACNITSIDCIVKAKLEMTKQGSAGLCICLRDCVSYRYRVELSIGNLMALPNLHTSYFAENKQRQFWQTLCAGIQFNKSTSILHFFHNSVLVKQKQETVMSLISLASNLGGVFGLCLGCSVMSVLEIFYYLHSAIRNKIQDHFQRLRARKNRVDFIHEEWVNKNKSRESYKNFHRNRFHKQPIFSNRKQRPIII